MSDLIFTEFKHLLATPAGKTVKKYFKTEYFEMHFDLSYRTSIHDCLDFLNPYIVQEYRSRMISYLEEIYFESETAMQIM